MRKKKIKVGDVFEIVLPNGKFAYGRVYKDARIRIYDNFSNIPNSPPIGLRKFLFEVGMYRDLLTLGELTIVGYDGFNSEEEMWGSPMFMRDPINNKFSIYHKGIIKSATEVECQGLERAAVWDLSHIVKRIMDEINF